jgi:hypothetical protein
MDEPLNGSHRPTLMGDCVSSALMCYIAFALAPQRTSYGSAGGCKICEPSIGSYELPLTDDCICLVPATVLRTLFLTRGYSILLASEEDEGRLLVGHTVKLPTRIRYIRSDSAKATPSRKSAAKAFNAIPSQIHPVIEQRMPKYQS